MSYKGKYRRKNTTSSIIDDVTQIGAKVSWQYALLLGCILFVLFYFILPAWFTLILQEQKDNIFFPVLETVFARKLHWLQWIGITTGLIGLYFAFRNYLYENAAIKEEASLISLIAKLLGKWMN